MKIDKHGFGITDDLTVNEKENIIYILEFKRFSYTGSWVGCMCPRPRN
jgi:hypothetical protein